MLKLRLWKRPKTVKVQKPIKSVTKGPEDVQRVKFARDGSGNPVCISGSNLGKIYMGRLAFRDGSIHRVAIKVFKFKLSDYEAEKHSATISDMRKAGVRLPKMAILKMPTERSPEGEWVQVSQLFGSTKKGSKIVGKSWREITTAEGRIEGRWEIKTPEGQLELVRELTKVANAGYAPSAPDVFEPFKDPRKGVIPIDLDMLHKAYDPMHAADTLSHFITLLAKTNNLQKRERKALFAIAMKTASPELKENLKIKMRSSGQSDFF